MGLISPSKVNQCMSEFGEANMNEGKHYLHCIKKHSPEIVRHGRNPNCGIYKEKHQIVTDIKESAIFKIEKLIEEADQRFKNGLYVSAILEPNGLEKIWKVMKKVGFRNLLPIQKAHITIIYSHRPPYKEFQRTPINGYVVPDHFEILGGHKNNPYVLALVVKSKELQKKHNQYMKEYKLRYDFKEYKPHITLVYDITRLLPGIKPRNKRAKESIENMFNLLIPDMPKQIRILKEEVSELTSNWQ